MLETLTLELAKGYKLDIGLFKLQKLLVPDPVKTSATFNYLLLIFLCLISYMKLQSRITKRVTNILATWAFKVSNSLSNNLI